MENAIIGVICLLGGVIYLTSLFKRRSFKDEDIWGKSMSINGWIGGLGFVLIGICMLLSSL